ncbi:MAG: PspC domain-containing protein [Bacteroidetes bacterium]|nr:PspC domain-containing protein [Bacteroidota bacterium]MBL7103917.1 PspC domain-containing protein [Bacteroidales bacterium]
MEQSRLSRSQEDSVIGGVCGGLGNLLNVDPILFRVLFVLAIIFGGSGLIVYIVLWIVIPLEETPIINTKKETAMEQENKNAKIKNDTMEQKKKQQKNDGNLWGGLILITLGAIFLIDRFVPRIDFGDLWPLILVVVGIILISKSYQRTK